MAVTIGSNILSQTVQRNLSRSSESLSTASERLSSGQRINKASDDAAGLSISMSLDKDRILARTAQRNISDGISMISIMGAGLSSQKEILFRMAELAEQSANGTYSNQQRAVLQKEYSSLMDEFDRIGESAEFNGIKLLRNRNGETVQLMAGITGADTSLLQVAAVNSYRFAGTLTQAWDINRNGTVNAGDAGFQFALMGGDVRRNFELSNFFKDPEFHDYGEIGFTNSEGTTGTLRFLLLGSFGNTGTTTKYGAFTPTLNGSGGQALLATGELSTGEFSALLSPTVSTSRNASIAPLTLDLSFATSGTTARVSLDLSSLFYEAYDLPKESYQPSAIGFTNLNTAWSSRRALVTVQNRNNELSLLEGDLGAIESRLRVAQSVLSASGENFAAASSRIKDADIAAESANVVRTQILQQTSASLLGQANLAPQIGLQLLQNA